MGEEGRGGVQGDTRDVSICGGREWYAVTMSEGQLAEGSHQRCKYRWGGGEGSGAGGYPICKYRWGSNDGMKPL